MLVKNLLLICVIAVSGVVCLGCDDGDSKVVGSQDEIENYLSANPDANTDDEEEAEEATEEP